LRLAEALSLQIPPEPTDSNQPPEPSAHEQRPQDGELIRASALHLSARFEGIAPDQPLPSGRRGPLIVSVDTPLVADHSHSNGQDKLMFPNGTPPLAYTVRINANTATWSIKVAEPTMLVTLSGETQQEAEFLIIARQPGYDTLRITV